MKRIAVTGGSGGAGRYVVQELLEHGYEVVILDRVPPEENVAPCRTIDLTNYGTTFAALYGVDAVAHFAAQPEPDFDFITGAERFHNNTMVTYNIFQASAALGMKRVVWASSETVLGFPFERVRPERFPVDETQALKPQNSYSLSKVVCEALARQMSSLYEMSIIALRFSNILFQGTDHSANYANIPSYWSDPFSRKFNLWGYIDARDAARCTRLALESELAGAEEFVIAARDTIMKQTNQELVDAVFPGVPIAPDTGPHQSLLSGAKAEKLLSFKPQYSWRDYIESL